jgi:cytochrome c biogenesis protein CcmG, thiol:disulfide interchange protein DsbE
MKGQYISFKSFGNHTDTAIIISFFTTWCIPCINELEAINEQYQDWMQEVPLRVIAISVDDSRTSARVGSLVKGKGWTFPVYLDTNNDLKRSLNINDIPHVVIIKNGKIAYRHTGYVPGNEQELIEEVKKMAL